MSGFFPFQVWRMHAGLLHANGAGTGDTGTRIVLVGEVAMGGRIGQYDGDVGGGVKSRRAAEHQLLDL